MSIEVLVQQGEQLPQAQMEPLSLQHWLMSLR